MKYPCKQKRLHKPKMIKSVVHCTIMKGMDIHEQVAGIGFCGSEFLIPTFIVGITKKVKLFRTAT